MNQLEKLTEAVQQLTFKVERHFHKCDVCEKFHENPLTQVDDITIICDRCLEEEYELIDGSYILKTGQAA